MRQLRNGSANARKALHAQMRIVFQNIGVCSVGAGLLQGAQMTQVTGFLDIANRAAEPNRHDIFGRSRLDPVNRHLCGHGLRQVRPQRAASCFLIVQIDVMDLQIQHREAFLS